jgi:hypothetical protein
MGQGYYRNVDDAQSDPENIAARYLVGRNASLEVALTLQEYAENIKSASGGGGAGSPQLIGDIYIETGGPTHSCPEISQRLLTADGYLECDKIYAKHPDVFLFNPLTGSFNRITSLKIVDSPIVEIVTNRARLLCSPSHKIIKNTQDLNGTWFGAADEVLTYTDNCYIDCIVDVIPREDGRVMNIELEKEFIYVAGMEEGRGILGHNRKPIDGINNS